MHGQREGEEEWKIDEKGWGWMNQGWMGSNIGRTGKHHILTSPQV